MPLKRLAIALSFALCVGLIGGAWAQGNPFTSGSGSGGGDAPSARPAVGEPVQAPPVTAPGPVANVIATLAKAQRDALRELNRALAGMRDGAAHGAFWLGLSVAFAYGALHAAGPGHGKMMVVSYFLSRDARIGRGVWMGMRIAVTHVASAVVIAGLLATVFDTGLTPSIEDLRGVRIASYAAIIVLGLVLLHGAWTGRRRDCDDACAHTEHNHSHGHSHAHSRAHAHERSGLAAWVATAAGVVPCTGAVLVLLFAFGNAMLPIGLLMVMAIGAGMAFAMTALGLVAILARQRLVAWVGQDAASGPSIWRRGLDFVGPTLVLTLGGALLASAL
jgi:nickel/cobalt transporter (NicO) family protein